MPQIYFPEYIPRPHFREMAFLREGQVVTQGGEHFPVASPQEIWDVINREDLSPLFIQEFLGFSNEWLVAFLELGEINCDKRGTPLSQRLLLSDHTTRWIQSCKSWGYQAPGPRFLQTLSTVQHRMGIGSIGSPGAAGLALLSRTWAEQHGWPVRDEEKNLVAPGWLAHRQPRPNAFLCAQLKERGTGARSELCTEEKHFSTLIELDIKNAYGAALAGELPAGKESRFFDGLTEGYALWVAECTVTIPQPLCYGLFPVKQDGQSFYPREPGTYTAWLWNERVEFLREEGLLVDVGDGYGWWESTRDCALFVETMAHLRDTAKTPEEADLYKLCLVAAIGALGMEGPRYVLTREPGDEMHRLCLDSGEVTEYFKKEKKSRAKGMPHWMWCVLERVNCTLTKEAYLWMKQEMLVGTNTDSVLLKPESKISKYPVKGDSACSSGTWQRRELTTVTLPALRHLLATGPQGEKIDKRPGIPRSART